MSECVIDSGPRSYRTEPASLALVFAHVLNVPESEDIWPGDGAELFFPELFALRYSVDEHAYVINGCIAQHMRDEVIRLSEYPQYTLEKIWRLEHSADCCRFKAPVDDPYASFADELFCDDSDDGWDEPDTLDSELLLTEEYLGPDELTLDSVKQPDHTLKPQRRVWAIKPTEQED